MAFACESSIDGQIDVIAILDKSNGWGSSKAMLKIFLSYSRVNKARCEELVSAFSEMESAGLVELFYDSRLIPGEIYFDRMQEEIETADVALFLVSPASLSSSAVQKELSYALMRFKPSERGELSQLVPIILERCDLQSSPLGKFHCLPNNAVPLSDLDEPRAALRDIAREIGSFAAGLREPKRNKKWKLLKDDQVYALRQDVKKALAAMQANVAGPGPTMEQAIQLEQQKEKLSSLSEELRARLGTF